MSKQNVPGFKLTPEQPKFNFSFLYFIVVSRTFVLLVDSIEYPLQVNLEPELVSAYWSKRTLIKFDQLFSY